MTKFFFIVLLSIAFSSCVVSKKKYLALEQELTQIKADLKDDDNDGVPNYIDLEPKTEALAEVDKQGRTVVIEKVVDIDQDGILDVNDFCPTIKGISSANGCPDKDGDGVYDFEDKCPSDLGLKKDFGCPVVKIIDKITVHPILKTILFQSNTTKLVTLNKDLEKQIDTLSKVLIKNPTFYIEIIGHTDSVGDSIKKIKLSEKRAEKIKDLFLKKGVVSSQLKTIGKGSSEPTEANETKKGREANNRVECIFKIQE